jgi:hypothetical protein
MALKALVVVVAMVDGERREFAPGEVLPELHPHDVAQLKAMGAIEDDGEVAAAEKSAAAEQKKLAKEFEAVKKARTAAKESAQAPVVVPTEPVGN